LLFAFLTLLAGTAGLFHVQFSRRPIRRVRLASTILVGLGLVMVGVSITASNW
jgi:hypothetical protein